MKKLLGVVLLIIFLSLFYSHFFPYKFKKVYEGDMRLLGDGMVYLMYKFSYTKEQCSDKAAYPIEVYTGWSIRYEGCSLLKNELYDMSTPIMDRVWRRVSVFFNK